MAKISCKGKCIFIISTKKSHRSPNTPVIHILNALIWFPVLPSTCHEHSSWGWGRGLIGNKEGSATLDIYNLVFHSHLYNIHCLNTSMYESVLNCFSVQVIYTNSCIYFWSEHWSLYKIIRLWGIRMPHTSRRDSFTITLHIAAAWTTGMPEFCVPA